MWNQLGIIILVWCIVGCATNIKQNTSNDNNSIEIELTAASTKHESAPELANAEYVLCISNKTPQIICLDWRLLNIAAGLEIRKEDGGRVAKMPISLPRPFAVAELATLQPFSTTNLTFTLMEVTFDDLNHGSYDVGFYYDSSQVEYPAGFNVFKGKVSSNVIHCSRTNRGWKLVRKPAASNPTRRR